MQAADENLLECIALGLAPAAAAKPQALRMSYVRDLTQGEAASIDLVHLPALPSSPAAQMRYRHHLLAKSLARGASVIEASAETGYATGTISALQSSPAFRELLEYYKAQHEVKHLEVAERRMQVGVQALEELAERLDDPERRNAIPTSELRKIVDTALGAFAGKGGAGTQASTMLPGGIALNVQFVAPAGGGGGGGGGIIIEADGREEDA